jgi:hypothetical protein
MSTTAKADSGAATKVESATVCIVELKVALDP